MDTVKNTDPTRDEMIALLAIECPWSKTDWQPNNDCESTDADFDREVAIYYFASGWHGGQWSNLYSVLCMSKYKPSPLESSVYDYADDDDCSPAIEAYHALIRAFSNHRIVDDYELIDHGIDHSQYFPGCGLYGTDYTDIATGVGSDPAEALDDCLEQLASGCGNWECGDLKKRIRKDWPEFDNAETIAAHTVEAYIRKHCESDYLAATDDDDETDCNDDNVEGDVQPELDLSDCELYYHISIRVKE